MVKDIVAKVANVISNSQIAINKGSATGVQDGATAKLFRTVEITDPDSKEHLGSVRVPKLTFRVVMVSEKFCVATVVDTQEPKPSDSRSGLFSTPPLKQITTGPRTSTGEVLVKVGEQVTISNRPATDDEPPF